MSYEQSTIASIGLKDVAEAIRAHGKRVRIAAEITALQGWLAADTTWRYPRQEYQKRLNQLLGIEPE